MYWKFSCSDVGDRVKSAEQRTDLSISIPTSNVLYMASSAGLRICMLVIVFEHYMPWVGSPESMHWLSVESGGQQLPLPMSSSGVQKK